MYIEQQQVLADLEQSIEDRLVMQQPLAMLSGRLDLLLAQTLARKESLASEGNNRSSAKVKNPNQP